MVKKEGIKIIYSKIEESSWSPTRIVLLKISQRKGCIKNEVKIDKGQIFQGIGT